MEECVRRDGAASPCIPMPKEGSDEVERWRLQSRAAHFVIVKRLEPVSPGSSNAWPPSRDSDETASGPRHNGRHSGLICWRPRRDSNPQPADPKSSHVRHFCGFRSVRE
jgi:hypothetical protein